jgi:aspartate aminotransferase
VSSCTGSSRDFALRLLSEGRVAVAPGSAFGAGGEGFVRISLAASESDLVEGCTRLAALWGRLSHRKQELRR